MSATERPIDPRKSVSALLTIGALDVGGWKSEVFRSYRRTGIHYWQIVSSHGVFYAVLGSAGDRRVKIMYASSQAAKAAVRQALEDAGLEVK